MADSLAPSSLCHCPAKSFIHVHCICNDCNGKAVARRTQLRHIKLQNIVQSEAENDILHGDEDENHSLTDTQQDEYRGIAIRITAL